MTDDLRVGFVRGLGAAVALVLVVSIARRLRAGAGCPVTGGVT